MFLAKQIVFANFMFWLCNDYSHLLGYWPGHLMKHTTSILLLQFCIIYTQTSAFQTGTITVSRKTFKHGRNASSLKKNLPISYFPIIHNITILLQKFKVKKLLIGLSGNAKIYEHTKVELVYILHILIFKETKFKELTNNLKY